jgi:asparagine synthase (glutamine-hydrolysing)
VRGYFGWSFSDVSRQSAAQVASRIVPAGSPVAVVDGKRWALAVSDDQPDAAIVYRSGDEFSVVLGNPQISDGRFARLKDELGIAEACHRWYKEVGPAFLDRLTGPFSTVISMDSGSRILLAIDKIGIRPLYFALGSTGLAFASELQHLPYCSELDLSIDAQSVYDYLNFHVIPGPRTIYKQVQGLCTGTYVEIRDGSSFTRDYWQVEYTNEQSSGDFSLLQTDFKDALRRCVSLEVESSSDVGCFLSGGTDSSTLAGILSEVTGSPARAYSIGFDQQGFDEMEYARLAASHFGLKHHEYYVTPDDIIDLVPELAAAYGQPFGNSSVVPTYYCARMAASDGIKKLLGGDGGDELFGGNERYARQILFSYYARIPEPLRRNFIEPLVGKFPFGSVVPPIRKARRYIEQARIPLPDRLQTYGYLQLLGNQTILEQGFLGQVQVDQPLHMLRDIYDNARALDLINKMLALDLKLTLADNDLPKVSRMCELAGISSGYPFLREPLIDFSSRLPASLKVHGLKIRYFFKAALSDYLPEKIIQKQKHGFGLPFGDWLLLNNGLRSMAFDALEALKHRDIVRPCFIDDLRDYKIFDHPNYYGGLIWTLMILENWFEENESYSRASAKLEVNN